MTTPENVASVSQTNAALGEGGVGQFGRESDRCAIPSAQLSGRMTFKALRWPVVLLLASGGSLGSGLFASRLPSVYSAQATVTRTLNPTQTFTETPVSGLAAEVLREDSLRSVVLDVFGPAPDEQFRQWLHQIAARVVVHRQDGSPQQPYRETVGIKLAAASPIIAERLALGLAERFADHSLNRTGQREAESAIADAVQRHELHVKTIKKMREEWSRASASESHQSMINEIEQKLRETRQSLADLNRGFPDASFLKTKPSSEYTQTSAENTVPSSTLRRAVENRERFVQIYSDTHPAVVELDRQIARMKIAETSPHTEQYASKTASATARPGGQTLGDIASERQRLQVQESSLQEQLRRIQQQLSVHQRESGTTAAVVQRIEQAESDEHSAAMAVEKARQALADLQATVKATAAEFRLLDGQTRREGPNRKLFFLTGTAIASFLASFGGWLLHRRQAPGTSRLA